MSHYPSDIYDFAVGDLVEVADRHKSHREPLEVGTRVKVVDIIQKRNGSELVGGWLVIEGVRPELTDCPGGVGFGMYIFNVLDDKEVEPTDAEIRALFGIKE